MDPANQLTTPPQLARLIMQVLEAEGVNPNQLLHGTGLQPDSLRQAEDNLSIKQLLTVIHRALDLSSEPGLGLRVGARENISTWGMLGYALMSSATEREAIYLGCQFQNASSSVLSFSLAEEADRLRVELDSPVALGAALPFCVEEMIMGIKTVTPLIIGHPIRLLGVSCAYTEPAYSQLYAQHFDCPVSYNQPVNAYWTALPSDRPLEHADPASAAVCLRLVEQIAARHAQEAHVVHEVRQIMLRSPTRLADMEAVAADLGMSSRTLRRRLGELDTSFREIVDDVRKDLALDYLRNTALSIDQIAGFLGYTETTNFRRAFKRWTGRPPSDVRGSGSR